MNGCESEQHAAVVRVWEGERGRQNYEDAWPSLWSLAVSLGPLIGWHYGRRTKYF